MLPILRWAGAQVIHQVGDVMRVLTRALPMLLLFTTPIAGALDGRDVSVLPLSRKQRANMLLVLATSRSGLPRRAGGHSQLSRIAVVACMGSLPRWLARTPSPSGLPV